MTEPGPPMVRGRRRIPWLWVLAVAALAVGGGLFFFGPSSPSGTSTSSSGSVADAAGDVVGPPDVTESVASSLDLRRAVLSRDDHRGLQLELTLHRPLDREGIGGAVTYSAELRGGGASYLVQVSVGPAVVAAAVTDLAATDRPFALEAPELTARGLRLAIPADAVPELGDTFSWGVAARVSGAEDVAPSDRSALFPPASGAGIGVVGSKW